ncbi:MAG: GNAT family N-acetyltransferase [Ruminococcaceae bacterium]|nr:GNAT family N-acetyltransferase [Oscillospiraceae bacterium]
MQKRIITPRLALDVITDTDKDALIEIFRNDTVKATYMLPDLEDDDKALSLFEQIKALSEQHGRYVRGIYLEGKLIGLINDTDIDGKTVEIGYALHPAFHSKGYMTEAVVAMISALFECGFEQVSAAAFEENAASFRVMQKCGMERIDKTETLEYRGKAHRCIYYSIKSSF